MLKEPRSFRLEYCAMFENLRSYRLKLQGLWGSIGTDRMAGREHEEEEECEDCKLQTILRVNVLDSPFL